jgi:hypothetical protein
MKTLFFAILACFMLNSIFAQPPAKPSNTVANINANNNNNSSSNNPPANNQNNTGSYLKAKKDNITFEGILNLQLMNQPLGIKFEEIKVRYFISEKRAYRGRGMITMSSINKTITGLNGENAKIYETNQSFTLGGGVEQHIKSKNDLSPYWGVELLISISSNTVNGSNTDDATTFKKGYTYNSSNTEQGIYAGGILGLDYYLNSSFYIGTEIRYGYQSISLGNLDKSVFGPAGTTTTGESLGTNSSLAMSYTNGIRLGYKF